MLFNSLHFLVFFVFTLSLYYALPHRFRWFMLLVLSCYFYMVFVPWYVLILFAVILIDYLAAFLIAGTTGIGPQLFLFLSLGANLGILFYFKYYNFFIDNVDVLLHSLHIKNPFVLLEVILPIGLSFHTFQAMSYTIEVYRGNQKPEKHLGIYALYVLFFPQLVAGPIERPQNLLQQFKTKQVFSFSNLRSGLLLMAWGMFKKAVVADRLAGVVDQCYGTVETQTTQQMWMGVLCYSFQIYCDFSGYSDIAVGAARTMGIRLMENFNNPYLASSVNDFWKRWHISLSGWFRDYVYIPMGGSKVNMQKYCRNILVVFALSGLWHGARYTFITWGLVHALLIIIERMVTKNRSASMSLIQRVFKIVFTFILLSLTWVFFRSASIKEACAVFKKLFVYSGQQFNSLPMNGIEIIFSIGLLLVLLYSEKKVKNGFIERSAMYYPLLIVTIAACYFFGIYNYKQFIYFQF